MVLWGVLLLAAAAGAVPCVGAGSLMLEPPAFFSVIKRVQVVSAKTNEQFGPILFSLFMPDP